VSPILLQRALVVLLLLASVCTPARAGAEDELRAIEEQRREAIRSKDFARLAQIYAPSFRAVAGNGQVIDREQLFRVFANTDAALSFKTDEVQVVQHGDTAVFIGRLLAHTGDGRPVFASRFSHVFVRQGGQWVCIAGQSTPVPAARPASG
jgi:ketosteroid isomerase-like protein